MRRRPSSDPFLHKTKASQKDTHHILSPTTPNTRNLIIYKDTNIYRHFHRHLLRGEEMVAYITQKTEAQIISISSLSSMPQV